MRHSAVLHHAPIGHHHIRVHLVRITAIWICVRRSCTRKLLRVIEHHMLLMRLLRRAGLIEGGWCLTTLVVAKAGCIHDGDE